MQVQYMPGFIIMLPYAYSLLFACLVVLLILSDNKNQFMIMYIIIIGWGFFLF